MHELSYFNGRAERRPGREQRGEQRLSGGSGRAGKGRNGDTGARHRDTFPTRAQQLRRGALRAARLRGAESSASLSERRSGFRAGDPERLLSHRAPYPLPSALRATPARAAAPPHGQRLLRTAAAPARCEQHARLAWSQSRQGTGALTALPPPPPRPLPGGAAAAPRSAAALPCRAVLGWAVLGSAQPAPLRPGSVPAPARPPGAPAPAALGIVGLVVAESGLRAPGPRARFRTTPGVW